MVTEKDRRSDQMLMDQTRPGVGPFPEGEKNYE